MDRLDREVRLGLVMYGGVSLAIYINGVAHEFFRAMRGLGVYSLIKALTDSDIVVDVISGTSAGGVNGILLGYCLTNGLNFAECADFWRDKGAIESLLRDPENTPEDTHSVLNSEGFYQPQLEQAFDILLGSPAPSPLNKQWVSTFPELDVFITGTDAHGQIFTSFDDSGHELTIKDHRAVFVLRHRAGRKEPFKADINQDHDDVIKALAKLSRLTSAFPVAFAPVHVTNGAGADAKLREWGRLPGEAYFLDGGILDNKPFTHAIGAIYSRTATRPVERRLFYVDPTPEEFDPQPSVQQPNFFRVISDSLSGIPSYESIAEDLITLQEHNSQVRDFNDLLAKARPSPPDENATTLYAHARSTQLRKRVLEGIFKRDGRRVRMEGPDLKTAKKFVASFNELIQDGNGALDNFDVFFPLRRLFDLQYECLKQNKPDPDLMRAIGHGIERLEIVRHWMETLVDEGDFQWMGQDAATVWQTVVSAFSYLLDASGFSTIESLSAVTTELKARKDRVVSILKAREPIVPPREFRSLLGVVEKSDSSAIANYESAKKRFEEYKSLDTRVFPLQFVAGFEERDEIKVTRISAVDAQQGFSRRSLDRKLSGDVFHAFGGFFKRSWRSNDILWGRLDGLCELVECLLDAPRVRTVVNSGRLKSLLMCQGCLRPEFEPARLFSHAPKANQERIKTWLTSLAAGDVASLEEDPFKEIQRTLIESAQFELIFDGLPLVIEDSITDQMDWNQYRFSSSVAGDSPVTWNVKAAGFTPVQAKGDALVMTVASRAMAREALKDFREGDPSDLGEKIRCFFRSQYKVGEERIERDIPPEIIVHLIATAALLVRNCVITALTERQRARLLAVLPIRVLNMALRIFYFYTGWWRRTPVDARSLSLGLTATAAVIIGLSAAFWKPIVVTDRGDIRIWSSGLLFASLLVMFGSLLYYQPKRLSRILNGVRIGAAVALLALTLAVPLALFVHAKQLTGWFDAPAVQQALKTLLEPLDKFQMWFLLLPLIPLAGIGLLVYLSRAGSGPLARWRIRKRVNSLTQFETYRVARWCRAPIVQMVQSISLPARDVVSMANAAKVKAPLNEVMHPGWLARQANEEIWNAPQLEPVLRDLKTWLLVKDNQKDVDAALRAL